MKNLTSLFIYRKKFVQPYIKSLLIILKSLSYIMSALFIVALIFEHGFIISAEEQSIIKDIYQFTWKVFLTSSICHIALNFKDTKQKYGKVAWIVTTLLFLTLIPKIFPEPSAVVLRDVWLLTNSKIYLSIVLATLSILQLSNGIVRLLTKRIKPSFIFSISFLIIILIGAGLLMLPRATYGSISFIDALFISTSATCVTGLTTVDVATLFTPMGHFFIMILMQIGGLGVMTLTSFFAVFFMGNASLYNQTMMCDMVSSKSLNSLLSTLLYILGFTLIIESIGALLIFIDIHGTLKMTIEEEISFSIFHSISAFCNAGFSTMPSNLGNSLLMKGHNFFYLIISFLVILGGIGFPILVNLFDTLKYYFKRLKQQFRAKSFKVSHRIHLYDINTKIAINFTIALLILATLVIALLEWNNAFSGMPIIDKCVQSFFTAVSPRTAGFSSVNPATFGLQSLLLIMILMVIGGGTQSTAGGIKVNTFAVILLNLRAILHGEDKVTVFHRELSLDSIRRSNSTLVLYFLFIFIALFALTIFEPDIPLMALTFEAISALSTVGSSLNITPSLGSDSKLVVIFLMFIGRVGVLTMMSSIIRQKRVTKYKYPSGNIIIN